MKVKPEHYPLLAVLIVLVATLTRFLVQIPTGTTPDTTAEPAVMVGPVADPAIPDVQRALVANGGDSALAHKVARYVVQYSKKYNINPFLVVGIIAVEDAPLNPTARSSAGAKGIMQVMPAWARVFPDCGNDLYDPRTNICMGVRVLAVHLAETPDVTRALLDYNGCKSAGPCQFYPKQVLYNVGKAVLQ